LKFNVNDHILVPKHNKISKEEANKILDNYNISIKQLPKILINDPAIKFLDPKAGDVIKIERKSATTNKTIVYRVVVSD